MPAIAGTAYHAGPAFLRGGWGSVASEGIADAIYVSGPFGAASIALHSAVPPLVLLVLYALFKPGNRDGQGILLWFLLGWLGHAIADFLTHAENPRPLFWPLSDWEWSSPVSYYDPLHYGREFFLISHALILLIMAVLLVRRIPNRWRKPAGGTPSGGRP